MYIRVLGSAAGGGFPQWNCNCRLCHGVRTKSITAKARTQSSIAVSQNAKDWVICNASPDILQQIHATPALQPARTKRDTGIVGIILTDNQIDHTTGLLMLREGGPHHIYCTQSVYQDLSTHFPIIPMLQRYHGSHHYPITPNVPFNIPLLDGIEFMPIPLVSKSAPYAAAGQTVGTTIGIMMTERTSGKKIFYAPGIGEISETVSECLNAADCIFIDGSFWRDDEMIINDLGKKRALEMGHLPLSGKDGMIDVLNKFPNKRKILIHINNTNPILDEHSAERATLNAANIEVAYDGMEIQQ